MDAESSSVDGQDLSDLTLDSILNATGLDMDSVSLSNWKRSGRILGLEFLAQVAAHHLSSQAAWSGEMSLSRLSSLAGNTYKRSNKGYLKRECSLTSVGLHVILVNK